MMEDINGKYNFKKKSILVLLIGIFLIFNLSFVSAANFDNRKNFDKDIGDYGKYEIRDWFGLQKLQDVELKTNTDICGKDCSATKEIILYQDGILIDDIRFYKLAEDEWIGTSLENHQFYILDGEEKIPYELGTEVKKGTYSILLEGKKNPWDTLDWQIKVGGRFWTDEWATWVASLDVDLISYWDFESMDNNILNDTYSGLSNGTIFEQTFNLSAGIDGNAYGKNTTVDLAGSKLGIGAFTNGDRLNVIENGTISFWLNVAVNNTYMYFLGMNSVNTTTGRNIVTDANDSTFLLHSTVDEELTHRDQSNGEKDIKSDFTFVDTKLNKWHQFILTFNISGKWLYIDGILNVATADRMSFGNSTSEFWIGSASQSAEYLMDELGIWNRSLSPVEVIDLWNGGTGIFYTPGVGGLEVTLDTPADNQNFTVSSVNLSATITPTNGNNTNLTIYVWYSNGTLFDSNTTDLVGENANSTEVNFTGLTAYETFWNDSVYTWGAYGTGNDSSHTLIDDWSDNRTFTIFDVLVNTETYNTTTYETATETFKINVTADSSLTAVNLIYDSTSYAAIQSGEIWSKTIDIPEGTGTIPFNWTFTYAGDTIKSGNYEQTIASTNFSICEGDGGSVPFINFTFLDEETLVSVNATVDLATWNYWLGGGSVSKSLLFTNTTENLNYAYCLTPSDKTLHNNLTFQYAFTGYPQRVHVRSSDLTNTTTNQTLYLLSSTDGIYSSIQVQDVNLNTIEGITVTVERQFSGNYIIIGTSETDSSGLATFWLNPDYLHRITASGLGYTSVQVTIKPTQSSYTIVLGEAVESTEYAFEGISYNTYPAPGLLNPNTNYTFGIYIDASKNNLVNCKLELRNKTFGLLTDVTGCATGGGNISISFNTGTLSKIFGSYYVDLGEGYQLLKSNDAWMVEAVNLTGSGVGPTFWRFMQDFVDWEEFGETENRREFSRITFFFIALTIGLGAFSFFTGFEGTNPGGSLLILWGIIGIFSIGGLFTIEGITRNEFMAKYSLFLCTSFLTWGFLINHWRRNTA